MIEVTVKYTGTLVDKPNIRKILIEEDTIAAERPLANGKIDRLTVGDLFKIFYLKKSYTTDSIDPENQIMPEHFELWFKKKYLEKSNFYDKIISIEYTLK